MFKLSVLFVHLLISLICIPFKAELLKPKEKWPEFACTEDSVVASFSAVGSQQTAGEFSKAEHLLLGPRVRAGVASHEQSEDKSLCIFSPLSQFLGD